MRRHLALFFFLLISPVLFGQPAETPPKIGLTLSGGGAKGLAHIGILKAIDSAGLKIDYISGTSMGSIVGSLYAVGYSGKEIEKIVRTLDWSVMFSGKPSLRNVNIDEKDEVDNYAIEVPFQDGKFKILSGFIEGQEIWLKFQELFLPVYDIKDFSKLNIPFKCVATNLSTGKPVVLDSGELVTAIRSSMAIPSVFTPIDYKDTRLIDGGVVQNFPVKEVKAMGADYVIGVSVSQGLLPSKELHSIIDILYQIGFYKDADDFVEERKLCDLFIQPKLKGISAASFNSTDSIMSIGTLTGEQYYPLFKKLADSLRNHYPDYKVETNRLPQRKKITVDNIRVHGRQHTSRTSFLNRLNLEKGKSYDGAEIATAIRRVYGSQNYKRITYRWEPTTPEHANLVFDIVENPLTYFKAGIHYHSFSNAALIASVTSKNLLYDRSKTTLKINISENFRFLLEQHSSFGKADNNNLIVSAYHERFEFPVYVDFRQRYIYKSRFSTFDTKLQRVFGFNQAIGVGVSVDNLRLKPKVTDNIQLNAGNTYMNSFLYYKLNTINRRNFTTQGWGIHAKAGIVFNQQPQDYYYTTDTVTIRADTIDFKNYQLAQLNIQNYKALSSRLTLQTQWNTAVYFNYQDAYLNFLNVGGLIDFLRNQIPFAGLNEYEINTNSVSVVALGFQYQLLKNLYATIRFNGAVYDFVDRRDEVSIPKYLTGTALSIGYDTGIGPISISGMYANESRALAGYVNIGFNF